MRDIKFRAKRVDGGTWVYGTYAKSLGNFVIYDEVTGHMYLIDPRTLGQYTGLKDKNGVEIYEGDILQHEIDTGFSDEDGITVDKVYWDDECAMFKFADHEYYLEEVVGDAKVIGNIYENKELLK